MGWQARLNRFCLAIGSCNAVFQTLFLFKLDSCLYSFHFGVDDKTSLMSEILMDGLVIFWPKWPDGCSSNQHLKFRDKCQLLFNTTNKVVESIGLSWQKWWWMADCDAEEVDHMTTQLLPFCDSGWYIGQVNNAAYWDCQHTHLQGKLSIKLKNISKSP